MTPTRHFSEEMPGDAAYVAYTREVEAALRAAGWSPRGIFRALVQYQVRAACESGESAAAFAARVDETAPLGMASS
jgi:hypothetical protein